MANLSNLNNRFIVTDGGNALINATANLTTYGGLTIDNISNPSIAMKTSSASGWIYTQYITSSGTNNFSMGVNQSVPYWGVGAGAGMGGSNMDLVVNSSGNVGIGTFSPGAKLEVKAADTPATTDYATKVIKAVAPLVGGYTGTKIISLLGGFDGAIHAVDFGYGYNTTGYDIMLSTNDNTTGDPIERMRITSGGNVLIGTNSIAPATQDGFVLYPQGTLHLTRADDYVLYLNRRGSDGVLARMVSDGVVVGGISVTGSSTTYNTSSDYRLKENVVSMTGALDRVSQLKPSRFNFIADADKTVDGFLAHEVQHIVPEAITGEKDAVDKEGNAKYQGIDQSKLVPLLVGAIQELEARIKILENK